MRGLAAGLALLLAAAPAAAQKSLAIKQFDATIAVRQDGVVDVTEAITVQFTGSWNGVYRTVPIEYRSPKGFSWTLRLEFVDAVDDAGQALKVDRQRSGKDIKFKIWVPGASDATKRVRLHYRARNGLRFFDDHDELYWNITGDEWDVPIEAATARVELPAGAAGVRAIAFTGAYGATEHDAEVKVEGTTIRFATTKPLGFHEGVTAVVGWNKGLVAQPTQAQNALDFLGANWPVALPIPVFLAMLAFWRRTGRDPDALPASVQYEPPLDLTPAEAGTLIDESVDMRDITATVVNLAVGGHLLIEEREDPKLFGLWKATEYVFHLKDDASVAKPLPRHERLVLDGIFSGSAREVALSELSQKFYANIPGIASALYESLVERGLYGTRPDQVKAKWTGLGVAFGVLTVVGGVLVAAKLAMSPLPVFLGGGLSALIIALFGRVMPARTVKGARTLEQVLGFQEFLRRVEGDRYERVVRTPEMFETFLPYAMAFGVEKRWAAAFKDIVLEPPRWYAGSNLSGFNANAFSTRLSDMSTRAGSTMSSAPRSSGGSGFGGGGSSGGGSGGGGGGGF